MGDNFRLAFKQLQELRSGPRWLDELRDSGFSKFLELGFPSRQNEDWKYTSLRSLKDKIFEQAERQATPDLTQIEKWMDTDSDHLLLVNGQFYGWLSPGDSVDEFVHSLKNTWSVDEQNQKQNLLLIEQNSRSLDPFLALNRAFLNDGVDIKIPKGKSRNKPIHILHFNTSSPLERDCAVFSRIWIHLEAQSELNLRETFISNSPNTWFHNPVIQIKLDAASQLVHHRLQVESRNTTQVSSTIVEVGRDARYDQLQIDLGSRLCHHQTEVALVEPGANLRLDAIYLSGSQQHVDHQTVIDHRVADTQSSQLYKGVIAGSGRAVFNGKIQIKPNAQRSNAIQLNQNLLLSSDAEIDTKPQMEIDADDVKCSHGATVGQLDQDEIFYLRSRGINAKEAAMLLASGFVKEVIGRQGNNFALNWNEPIEQAMIALYEQ